MCLLCMDQFALQGLHDAVIKILPSCLAIGSSYASMPFLLLETSGHVGRLEMALRI